MTGWPWPLDGVQEWFEGLWNWVSDAVWGGIYWVRDRLQEALTWVTQNLEGILGWLHGEIWQFVIWLRDRLLEVGAWIATTVITAINNFNSWISGVWDRLQIFWNAVTTHITDALNDAWIFLTQHLPLHLGELWTHITSVANDIVTGLEVFAGGIASGIEGWFIWMQSYIASENQVTAQLLHSGFLTQEEATNASIKEMERINDLMLHGALSGVAESLGQGLKDFFSWILRGLTWIGEMIVGAIRAVVDAVGGAIQGIVVWFTDSITQALSASSPPKEIEAASNVLVQTSFDRQFSYIDKIYKSEPSSEDSINSATGIMGMLIAGGGVALSLAIAADQVHPLKNMGWRPTVREMIYWAGIPSVTAAIATLPTAVGLLTPLRYALMERWTPIVPDASDLVRFAVREIFIPEEMERMLTPSAGPEFAKYMAKHGYSEFWTNAFWAAHWVRPTVSQLTQYLYRHDEFMEQWQREIRLNDLVPYAIPWLQETIYPPYTRVDTRRMWDMRTVTEPQMYENYRWLGYDDEHAKGMVLWTKVYTALPDLVARYKNGWLTIDEVFNELLSYGMTEARAVELLQTKIQVAKEEETAKERDLTKTDILRLLGIGELTDIQAHELLMGLGYDSVEATYLVAIQLDRMVEEIKELTSSQVLKAYRYEIYVRDEAKIKLIETGWSENAAEIMLNLEDIRMADAKVEKARERDLTRTDIVRGMKKLIITMDIGRAYLGYMGYSEWEIDFIFAIEDIIAIVEGA